MKSKRIVRISLIFSLVFLFLLTLLFTFIFIISLKPVKLNLLNYFDRKSELIKNAEIKEIGDVFLSFNKVTKNFELLIEDLVIDKSYFPNILIGLDLTLNKEIFETSIKLFDSELEFELSEDDLNLKTNEPNNRDLNSYINFLNKFSNVQIINGFLKLKVGDAISKNYSIDLNHKNNELVLSVAERNTIDNYLSLNYAKLDDLFNVEIDVQDFDFGFLNLINNLDSIKLENLVLSGSSKFNINDDFRLNELFFKFNLNGSMSYLTYNGFENLDFIDTKILGEKNKNNIDIITYYSHLNSKIKSVLRIDLFERIKSKFFFEIDKINVSDLLDVWPKNIKPSVYWWMKENSKGNITNFFLSLNIFNEERNISFDNPSGRFDFDNTDIRYMESMPSVKQINGEAKIFQDKINFSIFSGKSEDLSIEHGNVDLFDLDTDFEKAKIFIKINGENTDIVNYLNYSPINKKNYGKLKKIDGQSTVELDLRFPLLLDLPAEKIQYKSIVTIENGFFSKIFNELNISDFKLSINIDNSSVTYNGQGEIFKSKVKFSGKQITKGDKLVEEITGTYLIDSDVTHYIFPNQEFDFDGIVDVKFGIKEDDNGILKIEGIGDLDKINLYTKFLGPNLDFRNGKLRFLIRPYDESYSGFLDIKTRNFSFEVNSIFLEDKIIEIDVLKFQSPIQNFKFKFKNGNEKIMSITGKQMTLNKIDLFKEKKINFKDIRFNLEIDSLIINEKKFSNSSIQIKKTDDLFSSMDLNLMGDNDFHKVSIQDQSDKKKFVMESNYIPSLLKIFDIDLNISRGSLKVEGEKYYNSSEYKGLIAGNDIVFNDAPFFANFFSIFSLEGLTQKLKDGGIIFKEFNAGYKLSNEKLTLVDSLLKGSELGIQFDTVIGMEDDYFMMNGSIIPAYTINTLITKFPIVGDIITAGSPEDGLIGANFRVEKINGEYEVFYNPISVFVPNIIKNFLGN